MLRLSIQGIDEEEAIRYISRPRGSVCGYILRDNKITALALGRAKKSVVLLNHARVHPPTAVLVDKISVEGNSLKDLTLTTLLVMKTGRFVPIRLTQERGGHQLYIGYDVSQEANQASLAQLKDAYNKLAGLRNLRTLSDFQMVFLKGGFPDAPRGLTETQIDLLMKVLRDLGAV